MTRGVKREKKKLSCWSLENRTSIENLAGRVLIGTGKLGAVGLRIELQL